MDKRRLVGTLDYSKWDNLSDSDSEEEEEFEERRPTQTTRRNVVAPRRQVRAPVRPAPARAVVPARPAIPAPTLNALQTAWNTDTSSITRPCAQCFAPNAPYKCSRCRLVRYCNTTCQASYHPIHRLECIDAGKHASFWGVFDNRMIRGNEDTKMVVLRARRTSKRRRALQRAAAANAVERARRARLARGGPAKEGGGGKGKGADEREEECFICSCEFTVQGDGGVAFCCPTSHYMCNECAGIWVNSVMGDLETSYPPKCPKCKAAISKDSFERQLSTEQQNTFRTHAARTALKPGERLIECKECGLYEVTKDDPVLWWCPHCGCGMCRVCNKDEDLPPNAFKFDIEKSQHQVCATLREPKALIENAIEEGSKMRCPACNLAGRKDDACTHMSCTKCTTMWCYVCGLSAKNADKAAPTADDGEVDDIFLHNRDWESNEKRCPMYLTQILEVDLNWMGENWEENARDEDFEDDERCLDYLHRFKTIRLLQEVMAKIGNEAFLRAFLAFDSIKNCGYTYDEIISTCTEKLIDRDEFLQNREEENDEEGQEGDEGERQAEGGGGVAFANVLERRQIELALEETGPGRNADGGGDEEVDADELEERLVAQAIARSADTAAEDEQLREVIARSADIAAEADHDVFRFGASG